MTPLIPLRYPVDCGGKVLVKDENRFPTGSLKARGLSVAFSKEKELQIHHLAIPTSGNAGAAMAAYARRGDIEATVFCPEDNTPGINVRETQQHGAKVWKVKGGFINDSGKIVAEGARADKWFDMSTLKEPYRMEGKKTMGLELAEQMAWSSPGVIFYPTGGGTGIIGMWKTFLQLKQMGWLQCNKVPRIVPVQYEGYAPIVRAWKQNYNDHAPLWEHPQNTIAAGILVPVAIGDFLILRIIRELNEFATSVSENEILHARDDVAKRDGLLRCPESAATAAAYQNSLKEGLVSENDTVVLFKCATGLKYPMAPVTKHLQFPIDCSIL